MTTDTLVDVETIDVSAAAFSLTLDDTLNVSNMDDGAYVDYADGQVRDEDGDVMVRIAGMTEREEGVGSEDDDTVQVADVMGNVRNADLDGPIAYSSFLNYDTVTAVGDRQDLSDIAVIAQPTANNQALYTFDLGEGTDRVEYNLETGDIAAVVNLDADETNQTVFVDQNGGAGGFDLTGATDRIDLLLNVDEIVASTGNSVLDFTGAGQDMEITFAYDVNNAMAAIDRMESNIRIADGDGNTIDGISDYVEYWDMDDDATVAPFADATWNIVEGSDYAETIIYQGSEDLVNEAGLDHRYTDDILSLRGGANDVNYTALETSISAVVTINESASVVADDVDYTTGSVVATIDFQDGAGGALAGAGTHNIGSYTSDNTVAAGTLKLQASQDAEDEVTFVSASDKLFILGSSPGVLEVQIGELDAMTLTGFEFLKDAISDDTYQFDSMITGLTYIDNNVPANDWDTIAVNNNAIGYDGLAAPNADDLDLGEFTAGIGIEFDIMDVTAVTAGSIDLVGETGSAHGPGENHTVIIDNLSLFDTISEFETLALGVETVLNGTLNIDVDALEVINGANTITFDNDLQILDFSAMTTDIVVEVTDTAGLGFGVIGGSGDDTITGGFGDDLIAGSAGADVLDGGVSQEVRSIDVTGALAADGSFAAIDLFGLGNLVMVEAAVADIDYSDGVGAVVDGAGTSVLGQEFANLLSHNLVQLNVDYQTTYADPDAVVTDVSWDGGAGGGTLTFTFAAGYDVLDANDFWAVGLPDTGDLAFSAESVVSDGGDGGSDLFAYELASDSTEAAMDSILNFTIDGAGGENDVIDIQLITAEMDGVVNGAFNQVFDWVVAEQASYADLADAANAALDGGLLIDDAYGFAGSTAAGNSYLFLDDNRDGTFDGVIELTGVATADFIAGGFDAANVAW